MPGVGGNLTFSESEKSGLISFRQNIIISGSFAVLFCIAALAGIVSNVINVKTFIAMDQHDGVMLSFLGLSISDLCYVIVVFSHGVSLAIDFIEVWYNYRIWFPVEPFGVNIFFGNTAILIYMMNALITTFLAVARCMCVVKPFQFKNTFTKSRSLVVILAFGVVSIFTYAPILGYMGMVDQYDEHINTTRPSIFISPARERVKDIILSYREVFLPIATQCIVVVCVVIMSKGLKDSSKFRQASTVVFRNPRPSSDVGNLPPEITTVSTKVDDKEQNAGNHDDKPARSVTISSLEPASENVGNLSVTSETMTSDNRTQHRPVKESSIKSKSGSGKLGSKETQVVVQVVLISTVYIISNTPKILTGVISSLVDDFGMGKRYQNIYLLCSNMMELFQLVNCSINTFVYYKFNAKFRRCCGCSC